MKLLYSAYQLATVLAFGFIFSVAGAMTLVIPGPTFKPFRDGMRGVVAWLQWWQLRNPSPYGTDMFAQSDVTGSGVTHFDPERAYPGYTIFTSGHSQSAFLIDMQGNVVHRWSLPYDRIWDPRSSTIAEPVPSSLLYWRTARLFPNGDLLALYETSGAVLWGYGLAKLDSESKPIWSYLDHVHHDVEVGTDGMVYTLSHAIRSTPVPGLPEIKTPMIDDYAIKLSADGKLLKKISIYDAFARSRYRGAMSLIRYWRNGDQLHTNAIKPVTREAAAHMPFAREGEVLLSFRNIDAIALLDFEKQQIVWFLRGPWFEQHDPEILPNGRMLIFDNRGDFEEGARSRVIEFDPTSLETFWQFSGRSDFNFYSEIRGSQQELRNGNLLITESSAARLLEVTRDKEVVWEYVSPFRSGPQHKFTGVLCGARRFAPQQLAFTFNRGQIYARAENEERATYGR